MGLSSRFLKPSAVKKRVTSSVRLSGEAIMISRQTDSNQLFQVVQ